MRLLTAQLVFHGEFIRENFNRESQIFQSSLFLRCPNGSSMPYIDCLAEGLLLPQTAACANTNMRMTGIPAVTHCLIGQEKSAQKIGELTEKIELLCNTSQGSAILSNMTRNSLTQNSQNSLLQMISSAVASAVSSAVVSALASTASNVCTAVPTSISSGNS